MPTKASPGTLSSNNINKNYWKDFTDQENYFDKKNSLNQQD
jgi:hypothetical protein